MLNVNFFRRFINKVSSRAKISDKCIAIALISNYIATTLNTTFTIYWFRWVWNSSAISLPNLRSSKKYFQNLKWKMMSRLIFWKMWLNIYRRFRIRRMSNFAYNLTRKWINSKTKLTTKSICSMEIYHIQVVLFELSFSSSGNTENAKERKYLLFVSKESKWLKNS